MQPFLPDMGKNTGNLAANFSMFSNFYVANVKISGLLDLNATAPLFKRPKMWYYIEKTYWENPMRSNKITWRISALLLSFLLILGGLSLTSCSETVADVLDIAIDLLEEESSDPTTDAPAAAGTQMPASGR